MNIVTDVVTSQDFQKFAVAYLRDLASKRHSQQIISSTTKEKNWCTDTAVAIEAAADSLSRVIIEPSHQPTTQVSVSELFTEVANFHSSVRNAVSLGEYSKIKKAQELFKSWCQQKNLNIDFSDE